MKDQIKQLTEDRDRYKFLWETDTEGAKVIMAEMEHEIKRYVATLKQINSSDNSTYNATIAHKVLKEFGKL